MLFDFKANSLINSSINVNRAVNNLRTFLSVIRPRKITFVAFPLKGEEKEMFAAFLKFSGSQKGHRNDTNVKDTNGHRCSGGGGAEERGKTKGS